MKDIRYWVSKVLSPEQTGEKQPEPKHSLKERLQYEQEQKKQKQVQKAPQAEKTGYGTLTGTCRFHLENAGAFSISGGNAY